MTSTSPDNDNNTTSPTDLTAKFVDDMRADPRQMCIATRHRLYKVKAAIRTADDADDPDLISALRELLGTCGDGHSGSRAAMDAIRNACATAHDDEAWLDEQISAILADVAAEHDGEWTPLKGVGHKIEDTGYGGNLGNIDDGPYAASPVVTKSYADTPTPTTSTPDQPVHAVPTPSGSTMTGPLPERRDEVPITPGANPPALTPGEVKPFDEAKGTRPYDIADDMAAVSAEDTETPSSPYSAQRHPLYDESIGGDPQMIDKALVTNRAKNPTKSYQNLDIIFRQDVDLSGLAWNESANSPSWERIPSWRDTNKPEQCLPTVTDSDLDMVVRRVRAYFGGGFDSIAESNVMDGMVSYIRSKARQFNPVLSHIDELPEFIENDDLYSIERPISVVEDTPYTRKTFRNFFLGMMELLYESGEDRHVDMLLILCGDGNTRKTSWTRSVFKDIPMVKSYVDLPNPPVGDQNKDLRIKAHSSPMVTVDEVDTKLSDKHDLNSMKTFVTTFSDYERVPYARGPQEMIRHYSISATTNSKEFLQKGQGMRRFVVIDVIDVIPAEELTREHFDRLLAEARDLYKAGERIDMNDPEYQRLAEEARSEKTFDPVGEKLEKWLAKPIGREGQPVQSDRLSVPFLMETVNGLSPKSLQMGIQRIRADIRTYMNSRQDYAQKKTLRGIPGYNHPVKNGWLKIGGVTGVTDDGGYFKHLDENGEEVAGNVPISRPTPDEDGNKGFPVDIADFQGFENVPRSAASGGATTAPSEIEYRGEPESTTDNQ